MVAVGVGTLERLNANAWYGFASKDLVDATLDELQSGNTQGVKDNLRWLQSQFQPTYENRAHYDELVAAYVDRFGDPGS